MKRRSKIKHQKVKFKYKKLNKPFKWLDCVSQTGWLTAAEIEAAKEAKKALKDLVDNKIVILHCNKFDKYGRLLGTLYTIKSHGKDSININQYNK